MTATAGRRPLLLLAGMALALGLAPPTRTAAQEAAAPDPAAPQQPSSPAPTPARPAPPRRRRRRVVRREEPAPPSPPPQEEARPGPRLEPAPVPNRDLEPPRGEARADSPSLSPSIIHRPLPSTSAAREGAPNYNEERLFFPAPGARLTVPFSY